MIAEVWSCDRPECEEESPQCVDAPPYGWVEVTRYKLDESQDLSLQYCSFECAAISMSRLSDLEEVPSETE